jgi:hypothetical protein
MLQPMNRRRFLHGLGAGALILSRAIPTRAATQGDRLVVAVGQWGIETPNPQPITRAGHFTCARGSSSTRTGVSSRART